MLRRICCLWVGVVAMAAAVQAADGLSASADPPHVTVDTGAHFRYVLGVAWTPDGQRIVTCSGDKTVKLWDADSGEVLATLRAPVGRGRGGVLDCVAVSPDGQWLAFAGEPPANDIRVYDLRTLRLAHVLHGHDGATEALAFAPRGQRLAAAGNSFGVVVWDTASWNEVFRRDVDRRWVTAVAFDPSGGRLAFADDGGGLSALDLDHCAVRPLASLAGRAAVISVSWSPDGKTLACGRDMRETDLVEVDTGATLATFHGAGHEPGVQFTHDNRFWVADGASLQLHDAGGRHAESRPLPTLYDLRRALSPTDDRMAVAHDDGTVEVWSTNGARLWSRRGPAIVPRFLAISGNGDRLVWSTNGAAQPAAGAARPAAGKAWQFTAAEPSVGPWDGSAADLRTSARERDGLRVVIDRGTAHLDRPDGSTLWTAKAGWDWPWFDHFTYLHSARTALAAYTRIHILNDTGVDELQLVGSEDPPCLPAATDDDRLLAAASHLDGVIRIWSLKAPGPTVAPLLSLFPASNGEWVAWTQEGYYACSPGAEKWVGWQIDHGDAEPEYYQAGQFRDRFYRPDIIRRVLTCDSVAQAVSEADAARAGSTDLHLVAGNLAGFAPPRVAVTEPADGAVVDRAEILVHARLHDPNGRKVTSALLMVNGRVPSQARYIFVPTRGPDEWVGPAPLNPGQNVISVTAANDAGAQAVPVSITVNYETAAAELTKPALYVLAVGVADYVSPTYRLALAAKDARDFAAAWRAQEGRLYRKVGVTLLTDRDATRDNVLDGLDWLQRQVTQRDYAVVYLAGHGLPDAQGNFYFLPCDGDADRLLRTGVQWVQLRNVLKNLPCKVLLVLDTCHSGAAGTVGARSPGRLDYADVLRDAATDEVGVITLASCLPNECSYERPQWGNGAFTKALVEGIGGKADLNGDGVVSVAELDAYVADRVKELTDGHQHPTTQRPTTIRSSLPLAVVGR